MSCDLDHFYEFFDLRCIVEEKQAERLVRKMEWHAVKGQLFGRQGHKYGQGNSNNNNNNNMLIVVHNYAVCRQLNRV